MRRRSVLAAVPLVLTLTAGCSAFEEAAPPAEALETARTTFVDAGSVGFDLKQSAIPKGRNGVSAANGSGIVDKTTPKFQGQVTGVIDGASAGVEIIAIDDKTWMSFFTEEYNPIDLSELGAPNPSGFFVPEKGLSRLLTETTGVSAGEAKRQGDTVLQTYSGALPGAPVDDLLVFHIVFGKTVPDISLNAVANLGYADGRFLKPVFPGDTLSTTSEVIGLKQTSGGDAGIVYCMSRKKVEETAAWLAERGIS